MGWFKRWLKRRREAQKPKPAPPPEVYTPPAPPTPVPPPPPPVSALYATPDWTWATVKVYVWSEARFKQFNAISETDDAGQFTAGYAHPGEGVAIRIDWIHPDFRNGGRFFTKDWVAAHNWRINRDHRYKLAAGLHEIYEHWARGHYWHLEGPTLKNADWTKAVDASDQEFVDAIAGLVNRYGAVEFIRDDAQGPGRPFF